MRFLGKSKEREEELTPVKKRGRPALPRGRRKKKEEKKPWGKFERYLILVVLGSTVALSGFLALSAREWKLPGLPRLNFANFSLEKTFVFGETAKPDSFKEIESAFKEETKGLSGVYGLYVSRLDGSGSYGVYEDDAFEAASLIKLPVLVALYKEAELGNVNLDEKYILEEGDKVGGAGSLQYKPAGTAYSYRQLAQLMGNQSDNTAFRIVRNLLGDRKIQETANYLGMTKTSLSQNETSPRDVGILLEKLYGGQILSQESASEILNFLTNTLYEDHLAAGIPSEIRVAHKYGREVHVVNDAGVVFSDKPFILVILSKGVVEPEADEVFPNLAKLIFEFETRE